VRFGSAQSDQKDRRTASSRAARLRNFKVAALCIKDATTSLRRISRRLVGWARCPDRGNFHLKRLAIVDHSDRSWIEQCTTEPSQYASTRIAHRVARSTPSPAWSRISDCLGVCFTNHCFVYVWTSMHNVRDSHGSSKHGSSQHDDKHDKSWLQQGV